MRNRTSFILCAGGLCAIALAAGRGAGASWTAVTDDPVRDNSYLAVEPIDADSVAVLGVVNSAFLVARSDDGGDTWQDLDWSTGLMLPMLMTVHYQDSDHGWLGGLGAIHYTRDGLAFTEVQIPGEWWGPIPLSTVTRIVSWSADEALAVGDRGSLSGGGGTLVLTTVDGGATWTEVAASIAVRIDALVTVDGAHTWMTGSTGIDTNGDDRADRYADGTVYFSADKGLTWSVLAGGLPYALLAIDFADAQHGWAVGTDGAAPVALVTEDGGASWAKPGLAALGIPPTPDEFAHVEVLSTCELWLMGHVPMSGTMGDLFLHSLDGGSTWTEEYGYEGDAFMLFYGFFDRTRGWAAGSYKTLLRYDSETADPGSGCSFPKGDPVAGPEEGGETVEEAAPETPEEEAAEQVEPAPEADAAPDAGAEDGGGEEAAPPAGEKGCGCALAGA